MDTQTFNHKMNEVMDLLDELQREANTEQHTALARLGDGICRVSVHKITELKTL
jgi:hypothetical protein